MIRKLTSTRLHMQFHSHSTANPTLIPDRHTFIALLKNSQKLKHKSTTQIHAQILKTGLYNDTFLTNLLLTAYTNSGHFSSATKLFDEIPHKDVISWTALISSYVKNNMPNKALGSFMKMRKSNVHVDEVTIVSVLRAVGSIGYIWLGKCMHGFYVECGRVCRDVYIGGALIDMYVKCGCCDDARTVCDEMPERNTISWSALIAGYVHYSRFKEALIVFQDMVREQVEPNQVTLSSVLTACAQLGALDRGRWVHAYIERNGLEVNDILGMTLIDMYAKCGCIQEAVLVFRGLYRKNVYAWTVMISGLAMHGYASSSLILFSQMLKCGERPNEVTMLGVLSACCHGGLVVEGRRIFSSMSWIYGIEANMSHYGCMVDLLGRAGCFDEAVSLIRSMPMEAGSGVWGALFGACMIHKNYVLGEQVGKRLIEMQPNHSGRYMLLANLYSICGQWDAVAQIRKLMKEKGVAKAAGWSLIEIGGALHEFVSGDNTHLRSDDMYVMLDGMYLQLKLLSNE